jgi:hypothetical protein
MNTAIFRHFLAQIPDRTKTILIAVLAFGVGTLFGGSGAGNGRYIPVGGSGTGTVIMDTRTGTMWRIDSERPGAYTRIASFSYF